MPLNVFRRVSRVHVVGEVIGILVFLIMVSPTLANDIHFISQGVGYGAMPDNSPLPCTIYRLDEDQNKLVPVWTLPGDTISRTITVYYSLGMVVIGEGEARNPDQHHVISIICDRASLDSLDAKLARTAKFGPLTERASTASFSFWQLGGSSEATHLGETKTAISRTNSTGSTPPGKSFRLAGVAPEYSASRSDLIQFGPLQKERFQHRVAQYEELVSGIPDGLVRSQSSRGWNVIANEEDFLAMTVIADRQGLTHTELIVFNRSDSTWHSEMLRGAQTRLCLVNGWLIGITSDISPKTDFEANLSRGPLRTREVILVNPLDGRVLAAELEDFGEVLWVTGDEMVYYHTFDPPTLYKARIQDDDLVDRQPVIKDVLTALLHWGFEMHDCED